MAAALGMILGAGAGYLGTQAREKRQNEHEANQHFLETIDDHLKQHPEDAAAPEFAKYGKKIYGEHWEPMQQILGFAAQAKQKEQQQFQELTGGGGQPSSQPMTGGPPPPGQGQPAASPTTTATASPQGFQPPKTADDWEAYRHKLIQARGHFTDPGHLKALDDEISFAKDQTDKAEKHTEVEETRADRLQAHADTEADRQQSNAIRVQGQQIMAGLHQDTLAMQQQNAQFMHQMATAREDDQRQAHFQSASQSLASQTSNIAKMLNSATPADPNTVKTLLNARNAQARALKQAADKAGIEYDAEQFKPLTTQTVKTWGGLSSSTSLAESSDASGSAPNVEDFVKKYGGK